MSRALRPAFTVSCAEPSLAHVVPLFVAPLVSPLSALASERKRALREPTVLRG